MTFLIKYKRIQFLLTLVFIFVSHHSNAQKFDNARAYIAFIDSHNEKIVSQTWNYMEMYTYSDDLTGIKGQRKKLENILKLSLRKINKADAYDQELKEAAIDYIKGNLKIINNDLIQLIDSKKENTVHLDQIGLMQKIRKAMVNLRSEYDVAIKAYGNKHDLKLVVNDSTLARKMNNTIIVYDYYHNVQIEFNKLQRLEYNLWNGINDKTLAILKSDIAEARQGVMTQDAIQELGKFNGDNSLIEVLILMNDHIKEALENDLNAVLVIKKDQETGSRDQIMAKTKKYNAVLKRSNQNRKLIYNEWSNKYPIFLQKHINSI